MLFFSSCKSIVFFVHVKRDFVIKTTMGLMDFERTQYK